MSSDLAAFSQGGSTIVQVSPSASKLVGEMGGKGSIIVDLPNLKEVCMLPRPESITVPVSPSSKRGSNWVERPPLLGKLGLR